MHRFHFNFRKTVSDRAAEMSARAYNHYKRFKPHIEKVYKPFRDLHDKIRSAKYDGSTNLPPVK